MGLMSRRPLKIESGRFRNFENRWKNLMARKMARLQKLEWAKVREKKKRNRKTNKRKKETKGKK